MADNRITIRTMLRREVDLAVEWAAREGWNPGLNDAECFYRADPKGFLVGLSGEEPVATISVVKYGASFGFLGFYIVRPDCRGKGFGMQIWRAGLEYLDGRTVGLDGVVEQQENYRKSGFSFAYRNMRYEGSGGGEVPGADGIVDLAEVSRDLVISYDREFFPADRSEFLAGWLEQEGSLALGIVAAGKLGGYGVMRPCLSGYKVGPLFADSPEQAEKIARTLIGRLGPQDTYYLDIPELNPAAVALVEKLGMKLVFETARMYLGPKPELPLSRLYGVTSFELG